MRFSIIVPVYNVESVIEKCVESILQQTVGDFELILIDDGSQDKSSEICDNYAEKDSRILVFHQKNAGVSSARNLGIEKASGDFIVFIDSDDYIEENYLEMFEKNNSDLIITNYVVEDETGKIEKRSLCEDFSTNILKEELILHMFEKGDLNYIWAKCFRTDIIKSHNLQFDTTMSLAEDTLFAVNYIQYCKCVKYLQNTGYHYIKYSFQTLTKIDYSTEITIDKYETANEKIYLELKKISEAQADQIMLVRMAKIYKQILLLLHSGQKYTYRFVKNLFQKKWFKKVLGNADEFFTDESNKYRFILKLKSASIFWIYLRLKVK